MNKSEWKKVIEDQIKIDHDYIPSFQTTITILSEMLEERDRVYDLYVASGAQPVVNFTSDRGAVNLKPNPLWKQWQESNVNVLSYLRDLGLTAAGLRKLQGQLPKKHCETNSSLEKLRIAYELDSLIASKQTSSIKTTSRRRKNNNDEEDKNGREKTV